MNDTKLATTAMIMLSAFGVAPLGSAVAGTATA